MTWVKSAKAAIRILDGGEVTYMSFDHDLGPAEAGTGYEVAQWVEREAHAGTLPRFIWTVHSFNPVGSRNIIRAMTSAERYWRQHEESEHKGQ